MDFGKIKRNRDNGKQKQEADGKISLWTPDKGNKKAYIISGTVLIGDVKYRVFIYENDDPMYDTSPDYYGNLYLADDEEQPKKSFRSKVKRAMQADDEEAPRKAAKKRRPPVVEEEYEDEEDDDSDEITF